MSTLGKCVLTELKRERRPMTGTLLADLNGWPETTVRYWLRRLEALGMVARPYGRRSGFVAV